MKFRPCIDLHQGQVKQIVGSTLSDDAPNPVNDDIIRTLNPLATNFSTTRPAADFARIYQRDQLKGGHVIMLGPGNHDAAMSAVLAYPGGLQVGGGITDRNCNIWLEAGATHVIVTSHVFQNGQIHMNRLRELRDAVTKQKLVLDLSCRRRPKQCQGNTADTDTQYYVVTDRWQRFTEFPVTPENLNLLADYCDEFLVHGVDVEGKQCGILEDLVVFLGEYSPIPVTYAGGVRSLDDLELVERLGKGRVDCTVGSALDIFGGTLKYEDVMKWHNDRNASFKVTSNKSTSDPKQA